jgi:hypothetical protein
MDATTRRNIESGKRALDFSRAHPDGSPGYAAALARLGSEEINSFRPLRLRTATMPMRHFGRLFVGIEPTFRPFVL